MTSVREVPDRLRRLYEACEALTIRESPDPDVDDKWADNWHEARFIMDVIQNDEIYDPFLHVARMRANLTVSNDPDLETYCNLVRIVDYELTKLAEARGELVAPQIRFDRDQVL